AQIGMKNEKLNDLRISPDQKSRPKRSLWAIFLVVALLTAAAIYYAIPREGDDVRLYSGGGKVEARPNPESSSSASESSKSKAANRSSSNTGNVAPAAAAKDTDDVVLTVSGYVIPRERIELSPRFMGTVKWIGVKKGDP